MAQPAIDYCDECKAELYGELGVRSEEIGGIPVITIAETSPRNWILCDGCNALLCHNCCRKPETGYCNDCLAKQNASAKAEKTYSVKTKGGEG